MNGFKERLETQMLGDEESRRQWKSAWQIGLPSSAAESYKKHDLERMFQLSQGTSRGEMTTKGDLPSGVTLLPLATAKLSFGFFFHNLASKKTKQEKAKHFFPLLIEACCNDGWFVNVTKPCHETLWLEDVAMPQEAIEMRRVVVYVAKGASLDIVIDRKLKSFANEETLIDLVIEEGGSCRLCELDLSADQTTCSLSHVRAQVKKEGNFQHISATRGGGCSRLDLFVELLGEGSEVDLQGIWSLGEKRSCHTEIEIVHKAPNTRSNQHFKGVLRDKSKSTFEGKIVVEPQAQKTQAYQLNNNLILDRGANAFSKPNLEIFADDVKASHGATVTQLSEEELFYLRARGIDQAQAKQLLTAGFTAPILKQFFSKEAREYASGI